MRVSNRTLILSAALLCTLLLNGVPFAADEMASAPDTRLAVLWTSGDPEVAHKVCFMYTNAAAKQKWFDEVLLVVWGPSARLLAGDKELEAKIKLMMKTGVTVQACVACARLYGVVDDLKAMGIDVKPMGKPLSDMLKSDWKVITF